MKKKIGSVHFSTETARLLADKLGMPRLLVEYNNYARACGRVGIKMATLKRYLGAGEGYKNGPPALFRNFIVAAIKQRVI